MPSIETSIWLALKARMASLTLSPVLPVAWPNESFTPPPSGYLRVNHIPNLNNRLFLGSTAPHQRLGLLHVSVFAKLNQDASVAAEIAGKVAEHFPADLKMTSGGVTVRVQKAPDVAQALRDDPYWMVPVTIRYHSFK